MPDDFLKQVTFAGGVMIAMGVATMVVVDKQDAKQPGGEIEKNVRRFTGATLLVLLGILVVGVSLAVRALAALAGF